MAGVVDEYDDRRNLYEVPSSRDGVAYSDPGNAWGVLQYDSVSQQDQQQFQHLQQHWYGYYLPQQAEDSGLGDQEGIAPPPLPTMPPPQAPLPPSLATTPVWKRSDQGGVDGGADAYSGCNNYAQQGQDYACYGVKELEAGNNYANSMPQAPALAPALANLVAAKGSQSYSQGYVGYNHLPDPNAYGCMTYHGYSNHGFQKQGPEVYTQNAAIYSSCAATYASPSQYHHPGTCTDPGSYSSAGNYYDPNGYHSAGYGHPGDGEQTQTAWSGSNQGKYSYAGYPAPSVNANVGYGAVNPHPEGNMQYAKDYTRQWSDYYANLQAISKADTESNGAPQATPGGDAAQVAAPTYASVVASPTLQQPPPPGIAVAQPSCQSGLVSYGESQGSQFPSTTETQSVGTAWNGSSSQISQNDHFNQSYSPSLSQHTRAPEAHKQQQSLDFQKSPSGHNSQYQPSRAVKLHIVTNPRITGNFGGLGAVIETGKPAYVSVPAKNSSSSCVSTDAVADATLQPGMFPSSLRAYVERALSRCKDESQKSACQGIMKDMITNASFDGTLFTRDWDTEPLFAIPSASYSLMTREMSQEQITSSKLECSPARRLKSRWQPSAAEDSDDKVGRTLGFNGNVRVGHDLSKDKDSLHFHNKWEKREDVWSKTTTAMTTTTINDLKSRSKRGFKRLRKVGLTLNWGENASSESEEELASGIHLGSMSTADTPEEKERRQNRFKRFDRGKDSGRGGRGSGRGRGPAAGSASVRRATALQLVLNSGEGQNGRAVEDIDWDSLTIRGTCQEVEKRYLRLTSAPDPQTVRPEVVLKRALEMVKSSIKSYLFKCEQLKSIRQDLTVQRIRDEFTVEVYEIHARMALEAGDLPEYNQCQTQLKSLYGEGIKGCSNEFAAYSLLYSLFNRGNSRDLLSAMARLTHEGRRDEVMEHALAVRNAVAVGNYTTFFRLYRTAPVLSPCLMDIHIEKVRFEATKCMTRSYRPTIPVSAVARTLGFSTESSSDGEAEGVEDCEEWLRAHGAHVKFDSSSSELVVEAKLSISSLFMPEPEDVVPHGDANLALNDFFSRT
ncbi:hypothetical protein M758_UG285400 [Ceratodon purpureus]|nr:hypothetical protein M758_UG285400 [Ceratodon purpureus]